MKLILKYLKPHYKMCILIILLMTLDMIGALLIPTFVGKMLDEVAGESGQVKNLIKDACILGVTSIVSCFGAIMAGYLSSMLAARVSVDLRKALYKKTLEMSSADFKEYGVASITTRSISDINNICLAIINIFQMVVPVPIIFIVALALAFSIDYFMALILLGVLLLICIIALFIMKSASPLFKKLQKLLDKMSEVILENITGVRIVRAFNKEEHENKRLNESFDDYRVTSIKANRKFATLDSLAFFTINMFVVVIYYLSGFRISNGYFTFGEITTIIEYAILALMFLMMAQMVILTLPRAFECASRVNEVLTHKVTLEIKNDPNYVLKDSDNIITFKDVSFRFNDAKLDALKHLTFDIKKGEMVAIIGSTGSGKSTIASLIMRFFENTGGNIYLKDVPLEDVPNNIIKEEISYIAQKAWLFSGTIKQNLEVADRHAKKEDMIRALEDAQAGFVLEMPDKLNSFVSQGGTNFSGGQKQRLSIARGLLKDASLYIFDDSFSALDFKTDAALRKTLKEKYSDKTFLIIAQRITSIMNADKIIVLDNGNLVGLGKHEDLLKNCIYYKEIYDSQVKEGMQNE